MRLKKAGGFHVRGFSFHSLVTCAHGPAPPPQSSSICRAAIHYGILGNEGGLVDITRNGKAPFFVKSKRNGVESLR